MIVVNRTDTADGDLPTFIGYNPELFTIPMIGVAKGDVTKLMAGDGQAVTLKGNGSVANPTYQQIADFSSSGPRYADGWLKPDVAAPGVNLLSALDKSGWNGTTFSGTSMAAPMTSGVAALRPPGAPGLVPAAGQGRHREHRRRLGREDRRLRPAPRGRRRRDRQPGGQHQRPRDHQRRHRQPLLRLRAGGRRRTTSPSGSR